MGISNEKKALLHVGKQKLGWTDQVYRHVLIEHTGFLSSGDPNFGDADFEKVLNHMKAMGFWVERKFERVQPADAKGKITPGQQKVIEHLWDDLAEYLTGAKHRKFRSGFHERLIKRPWPQTIGEANHVIEVLKKRVDAQMRKHVSIGAKESV
jgi:hypothetical protein